MRKAFFCLLGVFFFLPLSGMNLLYLWDTCPYNWNGFYTGIFAGGGWGARVRSEDRGLTPTGGFINPFNWEFHLGGSPIGGMTLGYNYQFCTAIMGIENEFGYLSESGSGKDPHQHPLGFITHGQATIGRWYDALTLRLGYTYHGFLFYLKAGASFTRISGKVVVETSTGIHVFDAVRKAESSTSWAVGTGIEYAFCRNWSIKAEVLSLGSHKILPSAPFEFDPTVSGHWRHTVDQIYTAKLGINYLFWRCRTRCY